MTDQPTAVGLWMGETSLPLAERLVDLNAIRVVSAGTSGRGASATLADRLNAHPVSDLRSLLGSPNEDVSTILLLGSEAGGMAAPDVRAMMQACTIGLRLFSLEPLPASLQQAGEWLSQGSPGPGASRAGVEVTRHWPRVLPLVRNTAGFRDLIDMMSQHGPCRCASMTLLCSPETRSLGGLLFDALDFLESIMGTPERVDAAFLSAQSHSSLRPVPAETLHDLHGTMTAHSRYSRGRSTVLHASNRCPLPPLAMQATVRIQCDDGWLMCRGAHVEHAHVAHDHGASTAPRGVQDSLDLPTEMARQIHHSAHLPPMAWQPVLAAAGACLLSARTGEPESPATMLTMMRP